MSLSRQKGPVRHVVDLPASMRAPPPYQHLARWEGGVQRPGLAPSLVSPTETGERRREGETQRVLEEFGGGAGRPGVGHLDRETPAR